MQTVASEHLALVDNLRTAFECESNAHVRYAEFADKADGEGWHGVASLFRAVTRAEQIHASNHGRILRQLGGEIDLFSERVELKTTYDNLRSALATEVFEVDHMYPTFLEHARNCRDMAVTRTFLWALEAEKTHARLFNEALTLVELDEEDSWVTMTRDFFVCPVCGYTSEVADQAALCPACNCAWKRFEEIR